MSNIDEFIETIMNLDSNDKAFGKNMIKKSEDEIIMLCQEAKAVFLKQPMFLELQAPINLCGSIYGFLEDLSKLFKRTGSLPPKNKYLFLGNYIDRGDRSIETVCLLLALKIKYPNDFFLLRGCHESKSINRIYGFYDECKRRYSVPLWKRFNECFDCLPVAALIENKIFCCHGGLSPEFENFDQIRQMSRPIEVPDGGLLCDLLWSNPREDVSRWNENDCGISSAFGFEILDEFLERNQLDLFCRSHESKQTGYEFFHNRKLVNIFSAPSHLHSDDTIGTIMKVDENLVCSFLCYSMKSDNVPNPVLTSNNETSDTLIGKRVRWNDNKNDF